MNQSDESGFVHVCQMISQKKTGSKLKVNAAGRVAREKTLEPLQVYFGGCEAGMNRTWKWREEHVEFGGGIPYKKTGCPNRGKVVSWNPSWFVSFSAFETPVARNAVVFRGLVLPPPKRVPLRGNKTLAPPPWSERLETK